MGVKPQRLRQNERMNNINHYNVMLAAAHVHKSNSIDRARETRRARK